ncbi:kinesin-like protein KIN-12C isoform X2 [Syzygium oleosum]|uniref:kinesin-like protein KIN-12C isoform X2 n=1 Tax=Syzygium oleosum TaxID=219896 RepID=UPI0024BBB7CB|nr:kinesin-like protein KIN-12C isoform X2 [Syzygium oleosum]
MSKDACGSRLGSRRSSQLEASENEFDGSLSSAAHFPPPRTPLNAIQDPSQRHGGVHGPDLDAREKSELIGASRPSDKKVEAWHLTPRAARGGKPHSEPSSAQSTPARAAGSRASLGGAMVGCAGPRGNDLAGHRRMSLYSGASRGFQIANAETRLEVPHFELEENSSFWTDNNVQVLIRIRPLSNLEKVSQGYGRCIRQESAKTLVWLGYPETRFTFDHIACETISQEKLFRAAGLPMVENCLSGYNSCMFAYGQTGSGKTHTMMGDIYEVEGKLNEGCGITPRIFEYLFARIRVNEESMKEEKLTYSCKCSFLEIYNEQITDLLEPSSTNLQLREDMKKGVYVENLKEHNVVTVRDIVKLLSQGAANRKMAATRMNSESSRSHSVFTCIIESHWEKDSMTHFRFARLNLVDLAGSERQKSSAAEGDRLKEAANINKSLSTLGLVIMSLVDLAHGKHRHVPYRDSRLTFLLQDSLGGNSKTMIIANVSPSTCSANETLSTLKFAQRAKLIQNNAKVNEDASGDISALQRQIQQLKGQLSFLMKHQISSRSLSYGYQCLEDSSLSGLAKQCDSLGERKSDNPKMNFTGSKKDVKCSVATLLGSLRREKMLEMEVKKLQDEIEHLKCLAHEREEKAKHNDTTLKFREEKIRRLELLVDDKVTSEKYLVEENKALLEEINLLRERIDQNPELKQFAAENNRLTEQLQLYQDLYGPRERDILLAEVSDLRSQLLELEEKSTIYAQEEHWDLKDFEDCRKMNARLMREVEELPTELQKYLCSSQVTCDSAKLSDLSSKDPEEVTSTDKYSLLEEMISISSDSGNKMINREDEESLGNSIGQSAGSALDVHYSNLQELSDARMLIESMEFEQVHLIEKLQHMQEENDRFRVILEKTNKVDSSLLGPGSQSWELAAFGKKALDVSQDIRMNSMQVKRERTMLDLETANYEGEQASQLFGRNQAEIVMEQVEMETARTILQLQDEVASLQLELHEKLSYLTQENARLRETIATKEEELVLVTADWEKAILELTNFLLDGTRSLKDASGSIRRIAGSFPEGEVLISEQVERAAQACIEKEETVLSLQHSLENAQKIVRETELKLSSLKGATMSLSGSQHRADDECTIEEAALNLKLDEKTDMIKTLERNLKHKDDQISEAEKRVNAALLIVKWLSDCHDVKQSNNIEKDIQAANIIEKDDHELSDTKADADALILENAMAQVELARLGVLESKYAIDSSYAEVEMFMFSLQSEIQKSFDEYKEFVHDIMRNHFDLKLQLKELGKNAVKSLPLKEPSLVIEDPCHMLNRFKDELAETNIRLTDIKNWVDRNLNLCSCSLTNEDVTELDELSSDSSTSSSDFSAESLVPDNDVSASPSTCLSKCTEVAPKQPTNSDFHDALQFSNTRMGANMEPLKSIVHKDKMILCTRKELETTLDAFNKQYTLLMMLFDAIDMGACPNRKGTKHQFECTKLKRKHEGDFCNSGGDTGEKFHYACSFLVRFEQANATMKEADLMLNELLKANENAKNLAEIWRQTSEALMVEKEHLIQEIQQLKSSIKMIEGENQSLNGHIHSAFAETAKSLSLLQGQFLQMQKHVEDMFKALECDVLSMGQDLSSFICNSSASIEEVATEIMQRGIAVFVLWHCYLGELIHRNIIPRSELEFQLFKQREYPRMMEDLQTVYFTGRDNHINTGDDGLQGNDQYAVVKKLHNGEVCLPSDCLNENSVLKNELERKEVILQGLLFDLSMLQEAASHTKDLKDETKLLQNSLSKVHNELDNKMSELDNMTVEYKKLESLLADTEKALQGKISEIEQAKDMMDALSEQNDELTTLLKDLYVRKSEAEKQLDEQREVVKGLEEEILHLTSTMERKVLFSVESIQDDLKLVVRERDQLREQVGSLTSKLELAYSLADENEAIAIEARQESETSKSLAEQKEEEIKILEHSVEELEHTINVLEKKVYEMDQDVEKHRIIRDSLEKELQGLRKRLATVESFTENQDLASVNGRYSEDHLPRNEYPLLLELHEAYGQIKFLGEERVELEREIKQCKEYISELVLHAEAQASQYQQKYKTLENLVHEIKTDLSSSASTAPPLEKHEKSSSRPRGSSSPFRCISSLIQQTNLEKDQELSVAKLHIQELEALAASQQQEVCVLNSRLAAAESMTHDVIRDLLGVKLDMTNYANLIEQHQVQKLVEVANKQTSNFHTKEQEVLKLRKQIDDLAKERESCMMEISHREADLFATQMTLEQLQQRDQLLSAQNEMLKMDKTNLNRKVAELDEMVKTLLCAEVNQKPLQRKLKFKENGSLAVGAGASSKRSQNVNADGPEAHLNVHGQSFCI